MRRRTRIACSASCCAAYSWRHATRSTGSCTAWRACFPRRGARSPHFLPPGERADLLGNYYRRLTDADRAIHAPAAQAGIATRRMLDAAAKAQTAMAGSKATAARSRSRASRRTTSSTTRSSRPMRCSPTWRGSAICHARSSRGATTSSVRRLPPMRWHARGRRPNTSSCPMPATRCASLASRASSSPPCSECATRGPAMMTTRMRSGRRAAARAVWHPCTQMKLHETLPLVPIARGARRVALRLRRPPLSRRDQLVVGQPVRPRESAHQRGASRAQLGELEHVMLAGFTHAPVVELSERLAALAPAGLGHAFYASDGASATEIALKMSFHYWQQSRRARQARLRAPRRQLPRRDARRARRHRRRALPRHLRAAAARQPGAAVARRRAAPRWPRAGARASTTRCAALEAHPRAHHATTAALIVEPLVQGAAGMAMYDARYLRARARAVRALRRAPDRRRDHDRLRPHRHDVRVRAGGDHAGLAVPVQGHHRRLPAAVVRADHRRRSTTRSTTTTSRAASCIRTRTPATRSPAARRWRCSTSSATTTSSSRTATTASRWRNIAAAARRAPARAQFSPASE